MSNSRKSFWSRCEALPGLVAVLDEWRGTCGRDFPWAMSFLRPRQQLAESVPCRAVPPCGCRHEVIDRGGVLEAVCRCDFSMCDPFLVVREDLVAYELDVHRLCEALCRAFEFSYVNRSVVELHRTYHAGDYYPYEGYRFPAYLTIQHEVERLERVIYRLCSTSHVPFILLLPARTLLTCVCEQALGTHGSLCLVLDDMVCICPDGQVSLSDSCRAAMRGFHSRVVPSENSEAASFPTPPGSRWGDLHLSFPDDDHVTCRIDNVVKRYNFAEVDMRDRRSNGRTKQWDLLLEIAHNGGVLDRSIGDPKANKKQKQELNEKLIKFVSPAKFPILQNNQPAFTYVAE